MKSWFSGLLCVGFLSAGPLLAGCGSSEYVIVGTPQAVGADAVATAEEIEGGNQLITLEARNLPPADRLSPGASKFVMWFVAPKQQPQNMGKLEYDEDEREARGVATTPKKQFEIRVTAESDANAVAPSAVVVFTKQIKED